MQPHALTELTIARAAALFRARQLSPVELTDAYLRRIEQRDPAINAFITVTAEQARAQARRAAEELAAGIDRGALHGMPIALKDLFATAGIRTTAGSKILADWVPETDSTVVRKLHEAGAVLLGKLNMHEFAYGGTTANPHHGPTRNPWDIARIPGGSSGGSAAAMAAGLAAGTLGTDTAGSIRTPAAFCGVVGLKPTFGRVSKAGVIPVSWSFDHVGPIARTVEDAALLLGAIAGYDPADFATMPVPVPDYTAGLALGIRGLRIGIPRPHFFDLLDAEVRAAVEAALVVLKDLGTELCDIELPLIASGTEGHGLVDMTEARVYHDATVRTRSHDLGADVLALLSRDLPDAQALVAGLRASRALAEQMRARLEEVDAIATPTVPVVAPRISETMVTLAGQPVDLLSAFLRCVAPFSAAHLPALSLPCGFTAAGLPIGMQLAGRPFDEAMVLRIGHAYEQATAWHLRRPTGLDP